MSASPGVIKIEASSRPGWVSIHSKPLPLAMRRVAWWWRVSGYSSEKLTPHSTSLCRGELLTSPVGIFCKGMGETQLCSPRRQLLGLEDNHFQPYRQKSIFWTAFFPIYNMYSKFQADFLSIIKPSICSGLTNSPHFCSFPPPTPQRVRLPMEGQQSSTLPSGRAKGLWVVDYLLTGTHSQSQPVASDSEHMCIVTKT